MEGVELVPSEECRDLKEFVDQSVESSPNFKHSMEVEREEHFRLHLEFWFVSFEFFQMQNLVYQIENKDHRCLDVVG